MGSTVHNLGWWYTSAGYCGYQGYGFMGGGVARTITSEMQGAWNGYGAYISTLYEARHTAMSRMATECAALGGDGVVAVTLEIKPFQGAAHHQEFQAIGTAVRAEGNVRPKQPFLSHVTGQDFAKLIDSGWVPVDLVFGASVGVRHDDWRTQRAAQRWGYPQEVEGWTDLVHRTRDEARRHLRKDVRRTGANGVVVSDSELRIHHRPCQYGNEQHDHVAEASLLGTAIASFRRSHHPPKTLAIMRV
jgi:uncharacterized protein YbjQ (UPF0145 family)